VHDSVVLRCACCGLPFATLHGERLIVESRHKGDNHINEISLPALFALAQKSA